MRLCKPCLSCNWYFWLWQRCCWRWYFTSNMCIFRSGFWSLLRRITWTVIFFISTKWELHSQSLHLFSTQTIFSLDPWNWCKKMHSYISLGSKEKLNIYCLLYLISAGGSVLVSFTKKVQLKVMFCTIELCTASEWGFTKSNSLVEKSPQIWEHGTDMQNCSKPLRILLQICTLFHRGNMEDPAKKTISYDYGMEFRVLVPPSCQGVVSFCVFWSLAGFSEGNLLEVLLWHNRDSLPFLCGKKTLTWRD